MWGGMLATDVNIYIGETIKVVLECWGGGGGGFMLASTDVGGWGVGINRCKYLH